MTAPDAIRRKALAILREGRVTVLTAKSDPVTLTVTGAMIRVIGTRSTYVVDYIDGQWTCTCNRGQAGVRCGHILAGQLITAHAETEPTAVAS